MIGIDTNVLVRYMMQDDVKQAAKATQVFESLTAHEPGFLSLVSVVELVWVLSSCFDLNRAQIAQALDALLHTKELVLDRAEEVARALHTYTSGSADFADCLIERSGAIAGCEKTVTFDVGAAKNAGMVLIR